MHSVRHSVSCHQVWLPTRTQVEAREKSDLIPDITAPPRLLSSLLHPGVEWLYKNAHCERQIQKLEKHNPDVRPLRYSKLSVFDFHFLPPPPPRQLPDGRDLGFMGWKFKYFAVMEKH